MHNRLDTIFGNDGYDDPPSRLKPFGARYRFAGKVFGITIWALNWQCAQEHCTSHGLKLDGEIIDRMES